MLPCPYCPAVFTDSERWTARDHLSDHITEAHQDELPKIDAAGGQA